jgi:hypothetical protein
LVQYAELIDRHPLCRDYCANRICHQFGIVDYR